MESPLGDIGYALETPNLSSSILTRDLDTPLPGLDTVPEDEEPPVAILFSTVCASAFDASVKTRATLDRRDALPRKRPPTPFAGARRTARPRRRLR